MFGESKFSPSPGQLVEKLIDSGVAAIVTAPVLMVVRCHWISSQADSERQWVERRTRSHGKTKPSPKSVTCPGVVIEQIR